MFRPLHSLVVLVAAVSALPAPAQLDVFDLNGDGVRNVIDVALERGLLAHPSDDASARGDAGMASFDPQDSEIEPGQEVRLLVLLDGGPAQYFGYSLDIDIAPVGAATGTLVPNASMTNFFDAQNLITAAGVARDPIFSVIQPSADGGLFASTNTADLSGVYPAAGVNDVLLELVLDASADAQGEFRIEFGPGTVFANTSAMPIPVLYSSASVLVSPDNVVVGDTHYEQGDCLDTNDIFSARETVSAPDEFCFYLSGMLQENRDPGRYPDTYLFMFDKDDNVVCEDNDSSSKGNGKASACYDVAPIPSGDGGATVRLGVTGRPDGVDNMFNGLFFNAPHGQLGEAEVCVTYYDGSGGEIDADTYVCTFVTGAEAFRVNYVVPEGTATVDVEIDNTTETFPMCNDVDFYEIDGLGEACDYTLTVIGGTDQNCERPCAILGWYDKNANLIAVGREVRARNGGGGQGAQLSVISDANGRVRLAVSGVLDEDFDGWRDDDDWRSARSVETPGYTPPPAHGCCTCYTIKIEQNKHIEFDPCEAAAGAEQLQLSNGDLNLDGGVDVVDLAIMLNNWGWSAP